MTLTRESMLIPAVHEYFRQHYSKQKTEVPFYHHRIDLFLYSPSTDRCIAVELKMRDWRRAFQQALVYQLCSDYVFIAMPEVSVKRVEIEQLGKYGIGLLSISERDCTRVLHAESSPVVNLNYRAQYAAILKG